MAIFSTFFSGNIGKENVFYNILEQKKASLHFKNKKLQKSKKGHFPNFYFFGNIGQENEFYHILERKTPLYALKTRSSKSRKIDISQTGLTHGFSPKI